MARTTDAPRPEAIPPPSRQVAPQSIGLYALAVIGSLFLAYGLLTVVPWLFDGPRQSTQFRDTTDASWTAAGIFEAASVLVCIVVGVVVVRRCVRERRLTFDAMFCIAWAGMYWIDPMLNFFAPVWMYSSNWVNLENWCGHAPGVLNSECGRLPEPVLFLWPLYAGGFLAFASLGCGVIRVVRDRWPSLRWWQMLIPLVAWGLVAEVALELPMYLLHLWGYPGTPHFLLLLNDTNRYPFVQLLFGICIFGLSTALRFFRDEHGRTLVERGGDHLPPGRRVIVRQLATYGAIGLIALTAIVPPALLGFYSSPYPHLPAHLVNGMCDLPGQPVDTTYGPCPGGGPDGWKLPLHGPGYP